MTGILEMIFISRDETFNVKVVRSESSHRKPSSDENCSKKPLAKGFPGGNRSR